MIAELLGATAAAGLAAFVFVRANRRSPATAPAPVNEIARRVPDNPMRATRNPAQLPILSHARLIEVTRADPLLELIRVRLMFEPSAFENDILSVIERFTEFVQLLPASESHHHAQPGGLLIHLLECAANACALRQGFRLPKGAAPEEQLRLSSRWSAAVFYAALLHDVGKPVSDLCVDLYSPDSSFLRQWSPIAGCMTKTIDAGFYQVDFKQRSYEQHKQLPVILLRDFLKPRTLQWLAESPQVMQELVDFLGGTESSKDGILHGIVVKADMESVASNLRHGPRVRFATARAVPLVERLMNALHYLLANQQVTLNRPGAVCFIDPGGKDAWFVAGSLATLVRDTLSRLEERDTGAAGIPTDNNRLFDTWAEYGAGIVTESGRAIWHIEVSIGDWVQSFTVLRFALSSCFSDGARPKPLHGVITIIGGAPSPELSDGGSTLTSKDVSDGSGAPLVEASCGYQTPEQPPAVDPRQQVLVLNQPTPTSVDLPEPEHPASQGAAPAALQKSPELSPAAALLASWQTERRKGLPAPTMTAPIRPAPAGSASKAVAPAVNKDERRQAVDRFISYLQQGIGGGSIEYNTAQSMVHFVPEGMLVLTPRAFKEYVAVHGRHGEGEGSDAKADWQALQQDIQKTGVAVRDGTSFILTYATRNPTQSHLNCYLIPDPERWFNPLPPPNPVLVSKRRSVPTSKDLVQS